MADKKKPIDYGAQKSHVYDFDRLQAQYGGGRFKTRGSKHLRDSYQQAWKEYKEQNPDAEKSNFRTIYTTDVEDEANITPWQQRARQDVMAAEKFAQEDEAIFRKEQEENFKSLDPKLRQIRGEKALTAIRAMNKGGDTVIRDLVKAYGSGGSDHGRGEITDDDFARIQSYLESRHGTGLADESNNILQALYATNPSVNSPLDRRLHIAQSPNYVQLSESIGGAVNQAVEEQRLRAERELEEERRAKQAEMQNLQLAAMKQNQYETLSVAGDTGIPSADVYLQSASRQLVDEQANLVNALKNGDIDTDEFAQKSALIKSQVPALNSTKQALVGFQQEYQGLLEAGELSASNSDLPGKLYNAIIGGDMRIQPDANGELRIIGLEGEDGIPELNMPLSQVQRLPRPTPKAQPLDVLVKGTAEGLSAADSWDENSDDTVRQQLDGMLAGKSDIEAEKTLKAIAVDSLGMTLSQAQSMLENTFEEADEYGNTNELEKFVEDRMIQEAQKQFDANKYEQDVKQAELEYKQAQANRLQTLANQGGTKPLASVIEKEKQAEAISNTINSIDWSDPDDINKVLKEQFGGVAGIEQIAYRPASEGEKNPSWWQRNVSGYDKGHGEGIIAVIKGKKYPLPTDPTELARKLATLVTGRYQ